jgi:hypothetical protein
MTTMATMPGMTAVGVALGVLIVAVVSVVVVTVVCRLGGGVGRVVLHRCVVVLAHDEPPSLLTRDE